MFRLLSALALVAATPFGSAHGQDATKVVVVVVGDADEPAREAAQRVDRALTDADGLTTPSDPGLRQALRGEPEPDEDDGLGRARAARRSLGLSEQDDVPVLAALGRMTGAVAIAVVRASPEGIVTLVFDVGRRSFFDGEIDATGDAAEIVEFTRSRAEAARRAERSERERDEPDAAPSAEPDTEATQTRASAQADRGAPATPEEESSFWEDAWPYLVAGALLIGTIIVFTIRSSPDDPPQPVLRFIPGGM